MPKGYPLTRCRYCQEPIADRAELSRTGLHPECGEAIVNDNVRQLIAHRGPRFDQWRDACERAFRRDRTFTPRPVR